MGLNETAYEENVYARPFSDDLEKAVDLIKLLPKRSKLVQLKELKVKKRNDKTTYDRVSARIKTLAYGYFMDLAELKKVSPTHSKLFLGATYDHFIKNMYSSSWSMKNPTTVFGPDFDVLDVQSLAEKANDYVMKDSVCDICGTQDGHRRVMHLLAWMDNPQFVGYPDTTWLVCNNCYEKMHSKDSEHILCGIKDFQAYSYFQTLLKQGVLQKYYDEVDYMESTVGVSVDKMEEMLNFVQQVRKGTSLEKLFVDLKIRDYGTFKSVGRLGRESNTIKNQIPYIKEMNGYRHTIPNTIYGTNPSLVFSNSRNEVATITEDEHSNALWSGNSHDKEVFNEIAKYFINWCTTLDRD